MSYTRDYQEIMRPESRVGKNNIIPRNIYRINSYSGSKPNTKTGNESRWVFVIGKTADKIHTIRLNNIKPAEFTKWLNKIREKRVKIGKTQLLSLLLKKFSKEGTDLFEQYIKPDKTVYPGGKGHYRIYNLEKITNIWSINFEMGYLQKLFGEIDTPNTSQEQSAISAEEIKDKNG